MSKMMKKALAFVSAVLVFMTVLAVPAMADGLSYSETDNGYQVVIMDEAGLYSESDKDALLSSMRPVTEYCNVMLLTTDNNDMSQENYSRMKGFEVFGQGTDFVLFLIDMDNRQITVFSSENIYRTLTKARANTITDNVYQYASKSDYTGCAVAAFGQIYTVLDGGNIPAPMKVIGCILIGLIGGLTVCYIIMSGAGRMRTATVHEIETGMGRNEVNVSNIRKVKTATHFIRASSGGGGGFGGGGGGGGFSGGGGGGGSHGF